MPWPHRWRLMWKLEHRRTKRDASLRTGPRHDTASLAGQLQSFREESLSEPGLSWAANTVALLALLSLAAFCIRTCRGCGIKAANRPDKCSSIQPLRSICSWQAEAYERHWRDETRRRSAARAQCDIFYISRDMQAHNTACEILQVSQPAHGTTPCK